MAIAFHRPVNHKNQTYKPKLHPRLLAKIFLYHTIHYACSTSKVVYSPFKKRLTVYGDLKLIPMQVNYCHCWAMLNQQAHYFVLNYHLLSIIDNKKKPQILVITKIRNVE